MTPALVLAILSTISIDAFKSKLTSLASSSNGVISRQASNIAITHGYTTAFQVGAFIALAGLLISAIVIRAPKELGSDANPVHAAL